MSLIKAYSNDDSGKQAFSRDRLIQSVNSILTTLKNFSETTKKLYWQDDTSSGGFSPQSKMGSLGADAGELVSILSKIDDHIVSIDAGYVAKKPDFFGISLTINQDNTVSVVSVSPKVGVVVK